MQLSNEFKSSDFDGLLVIGSGVSTVSLHPFLRDAQYSLLVSYPAVGLATADKNSSRVLKEVGQRNERRQVVNARRPGTFIVTETRASRHR